jgi:MYXO-CTERM domain-containing protein
MGMKTPRWIGITLLLIGCGGSSNVSIENFPQRYAEALCAKNFSCCGASELTGKTMSTCVTDNQAVLAILVSEINASQAQGRASYDPSASGTCIDSLKAMSCDEFKQGIGGNMAACMALITPKVALGGACTQGYECTTTNCEGAVTDPPMDGMCMAAPVLAGVNASCAANECVDTAYCDSATTTCLPKKGAGEACTSSDQCVNTCDTATSTCTCYAGCSVAAATTTRGTALSAVLLAVGLVFARRMRRRR